MEPIVTYYYDSFSGRVQPLEMMLEYKGVEYERKSKDEAKKAIPNIMAMPAITIGKLSLSQTTAIAKLLGDKIGLSPPNGREIEALKVALDIADVWSEAYGKRKTGKDWQEIENFIETRLATWFGVLESSYTSFSSNKNAFLFENVTYVDFLLANTLNVLEYMFGKERLQPLESAGPTVFEAGRAVHALEKVSAYVAKQPVLYGSVSKDGRIPF